MPVKSPASMVTLFMTAIDYSGGMERVHAELLKYLTSRGVTVNAVCGAIDPELRPLCHEVTLVKVPSGFGPGPVRGAVAKWRWMKACTAILRSRRKELGTIVATPGTIWGGDVILSGSNHLAGCLAHSTGGFPKWLFNPANWLCFVSECIPYHVSKPWLFVSAERARDEMIRLYHVPAERVRVVPYGVDLKTYHPAEAGARGEIRRRLGLPEDGFVVLTVTNEFDRKGCFLVLDAMGRLKPEMAEKVHYVVAGREDPAAMKAAVAARGLQDKVHILGPRTGPDLAALYQSADVFALPTYYETFAMVCMEAMACSLPVIGTKVGGMEDYMADGENSLVIARTVPDITRALEQVIQDPELLKNLSAGALATAQKYDWQKVLTGLDPVFGLA